VLHELGQAETTLTSAAAIEHLIAARERASPLERAGREAMRIAAARGTPASAAVRSAEIPTDGTSSRAR
jgi:hypothetical protein